MSNQSDLQNGIAWNPEHFRDISELERRSGFSFQSGQWLSDLGRDHLSAEEIEALRQAKLSNLEYQRLNQPDHPTQLPLI